MGYIIDLDLSSNGKETMQSIQKILVAVTGPGHESASALERAKSLARHHEAEIELFACVYNQHVAGERFFDTPGLEKARDAMVSAGQKAVDDMAAELSREGVRASGCAAWDYPIHEGIVRRVMESGADLLIAESTGRNKDKRKRLANTDWQLIRTCPCTLLLARSEEWTGYTKIVAAVDPMHDHDKPASLDRRILGAAQLIASDYSADLHVLHTFTGTINSGLVSPKPVLMPSEYDEKPVEQAHRDELDKLVSSYSIPPDRTHLLEGNTDDVLPEFVAETGASLVVMGAVSRSMIKRLLIGSTAEQVLDSLSCDVLVVKPQNFETQVKAEHRHAVDDGPIYRI